MTFKTNKFKVPKRKLTLLEVISIENLKAGYSILSYGDAPLKVGGVDKVKFKENQIHDLHKSLRNQSYKPSSLKRVAIPKFNGEARYLALGSSKDELLQAALYLKLKEIVEPDFTADSYGFRPNLGCHDALNNIKYKWQACEWIMTFDIQQSFKTVNHELLLKFLKKYCDQSLLELVRKILKAKLIYIGNINDNLDKNSMAVPQGSALSTLFCNIYFNKLDKWMLEKKKEWGRGKICQYNPVNNKIKFSEAELQVIKDIPELKDKIYRGKIIKKMLESNNPNRDPGCTRLYYLRYIDDFIIGVVGNKAQAFEIQRDIYNFLESKLKFEISKEKSKLYHGSDKGIFFLGVYIIWRQMHKIKVPRKNENSSKELSAIAVNNALLHAPIKKLLQRAVDRGFGKIRKSNSLPRSTSYRKWTSFEDKVIVNRFSAITKRIYNYYTCVNSKSELWPVFSFYRKACALTLADKHKIKTSAKVFKTYGPKLTIKDNLGKIACQLFYPETLKTNVVFKRAQININLKTIDNTIMEVRDSYNDNPSTSAQCTYPGCHSKTGLKKQHINSQINDKATSPILKKIKIKNQKTVMLCRKHHLLVHKKKQWNILYKLRYYVKEDEPRAR